MWKTIKHTIRDAYFYILGRVAPKRYADLLFFRTFKRHINWEDPQDINEKINWLKFNGDTSMWPLLADKYRVREYVAERGLAHLLVPIYGHWDKVEDIDWESLPNQFVMKTNNGSGDALICKDRSTLDIEHWKRHFAKQLKLKFGYAHAEPHYNKIKPCIIVEELLDATKQPIQSSSIADYKCGASMASLHISGFAITELTTAQMLAFTIRTGHSIPNTRYPPRTISCPIYLFPSLKSCRRCFRPPPSYPKAGPKSGSISM